MDPPAELLLGLAVSSDAVENVRQAVNGYLEAFAVNERAINRIEVVLEELVSNVVRHAEGAQSLTVAARCDGETLHLRIEDDGVAFNPLTRPDPAPYTSLEDAIPGGQGIPLIKRLSRCVSYEREGERNRLSLEIATEADRPNLRSPD